MRVRLEPHDEYMHDVGDESNFNESMYFNVYDPALKLGAFFRLGNRPFIKPAFNACLGIIDNQSKILRVFDNDLFKSVDSLFEFSAHETGDSQQVIQMIIIFFFLCRPFEDFRVNFPVKRNRYLVYRGRSKQFYCGEEVCHVVKPHPRPVF
jgi:hypothetical protein